jgi:RND family efflux transporter MFP subunit
MKKLVYILVMFIFLSSCSEKENKVINSELFTGARFVKVIEVHPISLEKVLNYSGSVKFDDAIDITSNFNGIIDRIYVSEGQRVSKDQLLAQIDKKSYDQFEANYVLAEKNYNRAKNLLAENAIDQMSFEDIENLYINSQVIYENAKLNLMIRAPFAGTITSINFKEKEIYNPMSGGIARLISSSVVHIESFVSDSDVYLLKNGQKVRVKINNEKYDGKINFISPENDKFTGLNRIKILLNEKPTLRYNQFVEIEFITEYKENVIAIPRESLLSDNLVIVDNNGYSAYKNVIIGMETRELLEVKSGLEIGDLVVVEGNSGLNEGYPLTRVRN